MKAWRLILLGAPGAGKGTQAAILSQNLKIPQVASGDLFRQAQARGDELGRLAQSYMEKGLLVPDEITVRLITERLAASDCQRGFLLDGFPRTLPQARALDKALGQDGESLDKVIHLKVEKEELVQRLSGRLICRQCQAPYHQESAPPKVAGRCDLCGGELYKRADDTEEAVKKRFNVYWAQTAPLIEYYSRTGKLVEVDGAQGQEKVAGAILATLRRHPKRAAKVSA